VRRRLGTFLLLAAAPLFAEPGRLCPTTPLSDQRIVLSTNYGDIAIALYPGVAPQTTQQLLKLVRLGVYDSTHFFKVTPGFALQLSGVGRRSRAISPEQLAAIHPLPAELNGCPHTKGSISMAHDPGNPNSAQTSFLVMLADIPQMDGKFAVVGEVIRGMDVVDEIATLPTDPSGQPLRRVEVERARVVASAEALAAMVLQPPIRSPSESDERLPFVFVPLALALAVGGILLLILGLAWEWAGGRAAGLLCLLIAYFQGFAVLAPDAAKSPPLACGLFFSALVVFKLAGFFESGTLRS
jgi:cyclophilin family peptidyl-prolyl cis-trans isomerase